MSTRPKIFKKIKGVFSCKKHLQLRVLRGKTRITREL
jgi:hypothetical protein